MEKTKKFINIINTIVLLFVTVLIVLIFYEGLTLKWYDCVAFFLIGTDILFILATIFNIILNRSNKIIFYLNIFSIFLILIMFILKFLEIEHPRWSVTMWYFYILFLYGIQTFIYFYKCICSKNN